MHVVDFPRFCAKYCLFLCASRWAETSEGIPNEAINHSRDAILASQYMADFFVSQARLNKHKYASQAQEEAALIYNYAPSKTTGSFVQEYYFHF